MTPKPQPKKPKNLKHRTMSFRKARLMREAEEAALIEDMERHADMEMEQAAELDAAIRAEAEMPRLDCGCIDHNDDAFVGCESCGYKSCLDHHHIDSTPANVDDWMCKKGYGCNAPLTRAMKVRGEEE